MHTGTRILYGMNRPLRARRRERVYVGPYDAFIHRRGFSHDVDLLLGVLQKIVDALCPASRMMGYNRVSDLANMHIGSGTDHINLDVRPVLGRA